MRKNCLIAAALASAAIGGSASAAQQAPAMGGAHHGGHGGILQADANGDGAVSRAEYQAWADQRFARMDLNHDGRITADERPHRGTAAPTGGAGRSIDLATFRRMTMMRFDRMDTNHNGVLDATEIAAMQDLMRARMAGRGGAEGPGMGHGHGGMRADANGDGRISREEFLAQAGARFDRMDTNHNGFIDADERPMHHGGHGGMHDGPGTPPTPAGQ